MNKLFKKIICGTVAVTFTALTVFPPPAMAQQAFSLPAPGMMIAPSPAFAPVVLAGIKIHPDDPFQFDFLIDSGESQLKEEELKTESTKLIKYFLASLTVPEDDLWVNLSPYEKDRIIPNEFGTTEMGRDLLAQDYLLKQLTASLIYPETDLGKKFWDRVYKRAQELYGTTDVAISTFNKVWVMPDKAVVNEVGDTAFVGEAHLKVMLEEDYVAFSSQSSAISPLKAESRELKAETNKLSSQIIKDLIIPEIEREVNTGKNFAQLRQVYNSLILAAWYKRALKESILSQVYADKNKVAGVDLADKNEKEKIYQQYLEAYKKGVYNFIKEEYDEASEEMKPRKYFSGGFAFGKAMDRAMTVNKPNADVATGRLQSVIRGALFSVGGVFVQPNAADRAMNVSGSIERPPLELFFQHPELKDKYTPDRVRELQFIVQEELGSSMELLAARSIMGFHMNPDRPVENPLYPSEINRFLNDVIAFLQDADKSKIFARRMGAIYMDNEFSAASSLSSMGSYDAEFPHQHLWNGLELPVLDLAAGPRAAFYMRNLPAGATVIMADRSYFIEGLLTRAAELFKPQARIVVRQADVRNVAETFIEKQYSHIRVGNMDHYVKDVPDEFYKELIAKTAPGGMISVEYKSEVPASLEKIRKAIGASQSWREEPGILIGLTGEAINYVLFTRSLDRAMLAQVVKPRAALTPDEIARFKNDFPQFDWDNAAQVLWEELVRDPKEQPAPQNKLEQDYFLTQTELRAEILQWFYDVLKGSSANGTETGRRLDDLNRTNLLGKDRNRAYLRVGDNIEKLKQIAGEHRKAVSPNADAAYIESLLRRLLDVSQNAKPDLKKLPDLHAFFRAVLFEKTYHANGLIDRNYRFNRGTGSLSMNIINALLRLYGLKGLSHRVEYDGGVDFASDIFLKDIVEANGLDLMTMVEPAQKEIILANADRLTKQTNTAYEPTRGAVDETGKILRFFSSTQPFSRWRGKNLHIFGFYETRDYILGRVDDEVPLPAQRVLALSFVAANQKKKQSADRAMTGDSVSNGFENYLFQALRRFSLADVKTLEQYIDALEKHRMGDVELDGRITVIGEEYFGRDQYDKYSPEVIEALGRVAEKLGKAARPKGQRDQAMLAEKVLSAPSLRRPEFIVRSYTMDNGAVVLTRLSPGQFVPDRLFDQDEIVEKNGGAAVISPREDTEWGVWGSSLSDIEDEYSWGLVRKIIEGAQAFPERIFTVVDWGAGPGTALNDIAKELRERGIKNVRLVGVSNRYSPNWRTLEPEITMIFDNALNLDQYFEAGSVDLMYSYYGLHHFRADWDTYLVKLNNIMRSEGEILFNYSPLQRDSLSNIKAMTVELDSHFDSVALRKVSSDRAMMGEVVFSEDSMDRVLRASGTSLARLNEKLAARRTYIDEKEELDKLRNARSKDEIARILSEHPSVGAEYFPMAYNSVRQHFSVKDFLALILRPKGTWERSRGLLRWLPLIQPYLDEGGVNDLISQLVENEKDEEDDVQRALYTDLAIYAAGWTKYVKPGFRKAIFDSILERDRDFPLFNFLPWEDIPENIRVDRLAKYIETPFQDLEVTDQIIPVQSQDQYAGTCAWCQDLAWSTLMEPQNKEEYGKVGIIRINGEAVFSLKLLRQPSMVALKTLRTPDGRLAVVKGALYVPPKAIRDLFKSFDFEKDTFKVVDVAQPINILPLGWVDNVEFDWEGEKLERYQKRLSEVATEFSGDKKADRAMLGRGDGAERLRYLRRGVPVRLAASDYRALSANRELIRTNGYNVVGGEIFPYVYRMLEKYTGLGVLAHKKGVYSPVQDGSLSLAFAPLIINEVRSQAGIVKQEGRGTLKILVIGSGTGIDGLVAIREAKALGLNVELDALDINPDAVANTMFNIQTLHKYLLTPQDSVRGFTSLDAVRGAYDLILFNAPNAVSRITKPDISIEMDEKVFKGILETIQERPLLAAQGVALIGNQKSVGDPGRRLIPEGLTYELANDPENFIIQRAYFRFRLGAGLSADLPAGRQDRAMTASGSDDLGSAIASGLNNAPAMTARDGETYTLTVQKRRAEYVGRLVKISTGQKSINPVLIFETQGAADIKHLNINLQHVIFDPGAGPADMTGGTLGPQILQAFARALPVGTRYEAFLTNARTRTELAEQYEVDAQGAVRRKSDNKRVVDAKVPGEEDSIALEEVFFNTYIGKMMGPQHGFGRFNMVSGPHTGVTALRSLLQNFARRQSRNSTMIDTFSYDMVKISQGASDRAMTGGLNFAGFRDVAYGRNTFEHVFESVDRQGPYKDIVLKVPNEEQDQDYLKRELEFVKNNMGAVFAPFTVLENVTIDGVFYPLVVAQKRLRILQDEEVDSAGMADIDGETVNVARLFKAVIEELFKLGIQYRDAFTFQNFGYDPVARRVYFVDYGSAQFADRSDVFNRKGGREWQFYLRPIFPDFFNHIQLASGDELYNMWGTERDKVRPVEDVPLPDRAMTGAEEAWPSALAGTSYQLTDPDQINSLVEMIRNNSLTIGLVAGGVGLAFAVRVWDRLSFLSKVNIISHEMQSSPETARANLARLGSREKVIARLNRIARYKNWEKKTAIHDFVIDILLELKADDLESRTLYDEFLSSLPQPKESTLESVRYSSVFERFYDYSARILNVIGYKGGGAADRAMTGDINPRDVGGIDRDLDQGRDFAMVSDVKKKEYRLNDDEIKELIEEISVDGDNVFPGLSAKLSELFNSNIAYFRDPERLRRFVERYRKFGRRTFNELKAAMFQSSNEVLNEVLFLMIARGTVKDLVWDLAKSSREAIEVKGGDVGKLFNIFSPDSARKVFEEVIREELIAVLKISDSLEWETGYAVKDFRERPELFVIFADQVANVLRKALSDRQKQLPDGSPKHVLVTNILGQLNTDTIGDQRFVLTDRGLNFLKGGNRAGDCTACGSMNYWTAGAWNAALENLELEVQNKDDFFARIVFAVGESDGKLALWIHAIEFTPLARPGKAGSAQTSRFADPQIQRELLLDAFKFLADYANRAGVQEVLLTGISNSYEFSDILRPLLKGLAPQIANVGMTEEPFRLLKGMDSVHAVRDFVKGEEGDKNDKVSVLLQGWKGSTSFRKSDSGGATDQAADELIAGEKIDRGDLDRGARVLQDLIRGTIEPHEAQLEEVTMLFENIFDPPVPEKPEDVLERGYHEYFSIGVSRLLRAAMDSQDPETMIWEKTNAALEFSSKLISQFDPGYEAAFTGIKESVRGEVGTLGEQIKVVKKLRDILKQSFELYLYGEEFFRQTGRMEEIKKQAMEGIIDSLTDAFQSELSLNKTEAQMLQNIFKEAAGQGRSKLEEALKAKQGWVDQYINILVQYALAYLNIENMAPDGDSRRGFEGDLREMGISDIQRETLREKIFKETRLSILPVFQRMEMNIRDVRDLRVNGDAVMAVINRVDPEFMKKFTERLAGDDYQPDSVRLMTRFPGQVVEYYRRVSSGDQAGDASLESPVNVFSLGGLLQTSHGFLAKDAAMTAEPKDVGGIDFNPANLNLEIKRDGKGMPIPFTPQELEKINLPGLVPIIINITPVTNLPLFLGSSAEKSVEQLSMR